MNRSVADTTGEVLVVSQFTLYGDTSRGRRPSWIARRPARAGRAPRRRRRRPAARPRRAGGHRPLPRRDARRPRQRRPRHDPPRDLTRPAAPSGVCAVDTDVFRRLSPEERRKRSWTSQPRATRPSARMSASQSPTRVAMVWPVRRCTVPSSTRALADARALLDRPVGIDDRAEPGRAPLATPTARSRSRANRDDASCWVCTIEPWNDAPFVGFNSTSPPARIAARVRSGKKISHDSATPNVPAGVCRMAGPVPTRASRSISELPANGLSSPRKRHVLTERNPPHLLVAVDEVAFGIDRHLRVVEAVAVAFDDTDDQRRVQPSGDRRQHRALRAPLDRTFDVHDVLRPQHHVDRLLDGVAGIDVALEHDRRVGLEEPGALRAATLHERHPDRARCRGRSERPRPTTTIPDDEHTRADGEPPPGASTPPRARPRPRRWRGRATTSRRCGRRRRADCRPDPWPAVTRGRRRTAIALGSPRPASTRRAARSTAPARSAGTPCTPARTRRRSTPPRSHSPGAVKLNSQLSVGKSSAAATSQPRRNRVHTG